MASEFLTEVAVMPNESMTSAERVDCALSFDKPDRVPVVPKIVKSTCINYCGVTPAEAEQDIELAFECMLKFYDDIGGWDAVHCDVPDVAELLVTAWEVVLPVMRPGIDTSEDTVLQVREAEVMTIDDYDRIIAEGWRKFYYEDYIYRIFPFQRGKVFDVMAELDKFASERCAPEWKKRGVEPFLGGFVGNHPFFSLSLMRSFMPFTHDLYERPELVSRAIKRMGHDQIERTLEFIGKNKPKSMLFVEERAEHYPADIFERFWWPHVQELVDATWSEGTVLFLHLDSDWSKKLSCFRRLPRGSYVIQLDGTTDIVSAKEVLRGHGMLDGDVPAALQVFGTPEEVGAYVRNLIDKVGYEGGFFVSTGCETPMEAKFENMKALVDTCKTYELGGKRRSRTI